MKLISIITLILSVQFAFSVRLLMFGDCGMITWFNNNPSPRNDNFVNGKCPLSNDMTLGLNNFRRVMCLANNYLANSDIISVAGDVVYTETAAAQASANVSQITNATLQAGKVFLINNTFPDYLNWTARLQCGWRGVRSIFENYAQWCGQQVPTVLTKNGNNFMALQLVEGNHSFDVDINIEGQEMLNLGNTLSLPVNETLTMNMSNYIYNYNANAKTMNLSDLLLYPRITQSIYNGVRLLFLDTNSQIFSCALQPNQTAYDTCTNKNGYNIYYAAYPTFSQASLYVLRFINALKNLDPQANWRIIRGHHAYFTIDGGNDMVQFLNAPFIYNNTNYGVVIDLIKAANIHFHIASHMHLAYLLAFPYQNDLLKSNLFLKPRNKSIIVSGCFDAMNYFQNCTADTSLTQVNNTNCSGAQGNYNLYINAKSPEYFIQFTAGNSGRNFDQLQDDSQTRGALLWGRSMQIQGLNNFGGYYIVFTNSSANLQYFEIQAQTNNTSFINGPTDLNQFQLVSPYSFTVIQNNVTNSYPNIDNWVYSGYNCNNVTNCSGLVTPPSGPLYCMNKNMTPINNSNTSNSSIYMVNLLIMVFLAFIF